MLETVLENEIIFYVMGVAIGIGVLSKLISHVTLRRMVKSAGKMNKSNHKLMRLVKAKFEHASMITDKVQNVNVFVKKYLYEYRVFGVRLHTWRNLEKKTIWIVGILGILATVTGYSMYGMTETVFQYGTWTGIAVVAMFLLSISSDERYYLEMTENYMVDYLENVCAHRYEKVRRQQEVSQETIIQMEREIQKESEEKPQVDMSEAEYGYDVKEGEKEGEKEAEQEEKHSQEVRIREILEEYLA